MPCLIKLVKIYIFKDYFSLVKIYILKLYFQRLFYLAKNFKGGGAESRRTERKFKGGLSPLHYTTGYTNRPVVYTSRNATFCRCSCVYKGEFTVTTLKSRFSHCLDCLDSLMWEERIPKMADMGPKMADIG